MSAARRWILLGLVATVSVGSAVIWHRLSADAIEQAQQQLKAQTWLSVLPHNAYDNQPLQSPLTLDTAVLAHSRLLSGYRATLASRTSAVVLHSLVQGYGGPIELLVAIDTQGRLIGTKALRQQETPGLGAALVAPGNHWLQGFVGNSRQTTPDAAWALKRDDGQFDQLAGATITSRAVIHAVHDALRYFDEHRQVLLGDQQ
ncbi:RnfABCDGE type electron transport complex subunit G [Pseudomonas sp. GD03860]|uniref:RnfABCDGE type electron transport complex subunit G n=1 Tax=Pseudomonas TaxID=286 RepID=UPI0023636FF5|nr:MULTISPECIES: RnfABCDGE type electron transport complex subunit G [Pseudomonas]MDD2057802.1 RnfABCDGE type electron transport complex subunit G [Pseudomonas putida]MDH0636013.1 RnfABCDGE type electron transport complex subunit G [Pseudomonas sp. GD03860]